MRSKTVAQSLLGGLQAVQACDPGYCICAKGKIVLQPANAIGLGCMTAKECAEDDAIEGALAQRDRLWRIPEQR